MHKLIASDSCNILRSSFKNVLNGNLFLTGEQKAFDSDSLFAGLCSLNILAPEVYVSWWRKENIRVYIIASVHVSSGIRTRA